MGKACRTYGTPVCGQLFHAGRAVRMRHDGSRPVTWSDNGVADECYRVTPFALSTAMVQELFESYVQMTRQLVRADLDGVKMIPFARLFGADSNTAWFQHTTSGVAIVCENVDTIVSCYAPASVRDVEWIEQYIRRHDLQTAIHDIGDALASRSIEEAILEAHRIAVAI